MQKENQEREKIKALLYSGQEESMNLGLELARSLGYYEELIMPLKHIVLKNLNSAADLLTNTKLDLESRYISSLPEWSKQLTKLSTLKLEGNPLPETTLENLKQLLPNTEVIT